MKEKCKICNFEDDAIITQIFNANIDELASVTKEDKLYMEKRNIDTCIAYQRVLNAINNIPDGFTEIINELKTSLDNLEDQNGYEEGYLCEKYFRNGVKSGMQIIFEGLK